jgi:hypothetical protein
MPKRRTPVKDKSAKAARREPQADGDDDREEVAKEATIIKPKFNMPADDFSKAIRKGFRSSATRFLTRRKDMAQAIVAKLLNGDVPRSGEFNAHFRSEFDKVYDDADAKSIVNEYFKFTSTVITTMKKTWYEYALTDATVEELIDSEDLNELMVRKSRRDYPVDSKALAAANNGSQWTMHSKEVATERFHEAYEVSVANYFLFSSSITTYLFCRPLKMSYY